MSKKYSHQFIVAFTIVNERADGYDTPTVELQAALIRRAAEIVEEGEKSEAFQCEDTYEVES